MCARRTVERLTVRFSQLVGVPVSENEAQLVAGQLAEVGIEVEIVDVPVQEFGNTLTAGEFELMAFSWIGTPFPFRGICAALRQRLGQQLRLLQHPGDRSVDRPAGHHRR